MSAETRRPLESVDDALCRFGWYAVARKEFQDTIRSRWVIALSLVFVALFSLPPALALYFNIGQGPQGNGASTDFLIFLLKEPVSILIPLIAVVVGYAAITRERESGTLKILLSLPNTRRDVVLGKVIGRSLVVAVPILVGFFISAIVLFPSSLAFKVGNFVAFSLLTAFLGVVFTALGVGISAGAGTNFRSMATSMGLFVYFAFFWNLAANGLGNLLVDHVGFSQAARMKTVLFVKILNPTQAYKTLVDSIYQSSVDARLGMFSFFRRQAACTDALGGTIAQQQCQVGALPMQYSDPVIVGYMLFWLAVPVAVGYWVFADADL